MAPPRRAGTTGHETSSDVAAKAVVVIIGASATWAAVMFAVVACLDWLDVRPPSDAVAVAVMLSVLVGALILWIKLIVGWRALTVATIRTAFRAADGWRAIWEEAKQR